MTLTKVGMCYGDQNALRELYVKASKCHDVCTIESLEEGDRRENVETPKATEQV